MHTPHRAPTPTFPPDGLRLPAGLALAPGGSRARLLPFTDPPAAPLASDRPADVLAMLRYAGVRYAHPDSPAAATGVGIFAAGRRLALDGPHEAVTFDWDHTLSNYQIFEDVRELIRVRRRTTAPSATQGAAPMVAIETARPFMVEFAFGLMAGYALRQGLDRLTDWERYQPRVGVATHTWPDRLALLAAHFMPVLPLMEGMLPGAPDSYERFTAPGIRCAIHLHHFLDHATSLLRRLAAQGHAALDPAERAAALRYLEDGKAHHRKPLGAWAARGWDTRRLLHVDDSMAAVADLAHQATLAGGDATRFVHVRHPHSRVFGSIREWHKIAVPALWRGRDAAVRGVVLRLARQEWQRSQVPALLRALGHAPAASTGPWPAGALPAGVVLTLHETPTTVGEFWRYYVEPANRARALIRAVRGRLGGLPAIRRAAAAAGD